ncbi:MAG: hypothetical protein LBS58_04095 [Coriobacteriales bacterium]|nr:hypothetical protein [Coriobacteriales bacterium]
MDTFDHETVKFAVGFTEEEFKKMMAGPNGVLVLHNHLNGSRSSLQSIITNAKDDFIKGGMTIGHDGYVYYFAEHDRKELRGITLAIITDADITTEGNLRDQPNPSMFFIKEEDVVVVNAAGEFVSLLKGGVNNVRIQRSRP